MRPSTRPSTVRSSLPDTSPLMKSEVPMLAARPFALEDDADSGGTLMGTYDGVSTRGAAGGGPDGLKSFSFSFLSHIAVSPCPSVDDWPKRQSPARVAAGLRMIFPASWRRNGRGAVRDPGA